MFFPFSFFWVVIVYLKNSNYLAKSIFVGWVVLRMAITVTVIFFSLEEGVISGIFILPQTNSS